MTLLQRVVDWLNKIDPRLVMFLLLARNYLNWNLSENEEHYLALAKQYVDPGWIPNSFNLTEFAGTRLIYQYVFGFALKYFSFETVTFSGRLLLCVLMAWGLGNLLKTLKVPNLLSIFAFQAGYFAYQSFFGYEWIFLGVEAKCFAYVFVLFALNALLQYQLMRTVIFAALATLLHILVGGWFLIALFFWLLWQRVAWKEQAKLIGVYVGMVLPVVVFVAVELLDNSATVINGVNLDWVYTYFRNPHHTAIFKSWDYFLDMHAWGVALTVVTFGGSWWLLMRAKEESLQNLLRFHLMILALTLLFVLVALFDKTGFLLKYYPFRQNAVSVLLLTLILSHFLSQHWLRGRSLLIVQAVGFLVGLWFLTFPNIQQASFAQQQVRANSLESLAAFAKANTSNQSVFLFYHDPDMSFIRRSERDYFVHFKMNPSGTTKLYEWYKRLQHREELKQDLSFINQMRKSYRIDYLVMPAPLQETSGLELVFTNKDHYLYKLQ